MHSTAMSAPAHRQLVAAHTYWQEDQSPRRGMYMQAMLGTAYSTPNQQTPAQAEQASLLRHRSDGEAADDDGTDACDILQTLVNT